MKVSVVDATQNPVEVCSLAAGICYGKQTATEKRVANCVKMGHTSILEHAKFTLRVEGISRACMAQLTRHRMASFCVESQRYNRYDLSGNDWYVVPEAFTEEKLVGDFMLESWYGKMMENAAANYRRALDEGIKPEDARYLLPEATKTNLFVTMNARELFHFLDMRADKAAQWEIRELAYAIMDALHDYSEGWRFLIDLYKSLE